VDFDVFGDLKFMPVSLKGTVIRNIRVMHGYCELFGVIRRCLEDKLEPTHHAIKHRVMDSIQVDEGKGDGRDFLDQEDGDPRYALQYLITTLRDVMRVHNVQKLLDEGLDSLPSCSNDSGYSMLHGRLVGSYIVNRL
jgi:hypothetical protein